MNNNFHDPETGHYADHPDYRGDWWFHAGYEYPYEIYDALVAVERACEAGKFTAQADYDSAYAHAQQLRSPADLQPNLITHQGLRTLIPTAIDAERLEELQRSHPEHAVDSTLADPFEMIQFGEFQPDWGTRGPEVDTLEVDEAEDAEDATMPPATGLLVLSFERDKKASRALRWTSGHPLVRAIREGQLDSAVTLSALACGKVEVALTERSVETISEYVDARGSLDNGPDSPFYGLTITWRCLTSVTPGKAGGLVHMVHSAHSYDLWHSSALWKADAVLLGDTLHDPRARGLNVKAADALWSERHLVHCAIAELELFLGITS